MLLALFLFESFVCFHVLVPTRSMDPTIKAGDHMLVLRIHDLEELNRGDIVVFKVHHEQPKPGQPTDELYVKRLIGLPGDTVDLRSGQVFINGQKIQEDYVVNKDRFSGSYKVPMGQYFFLGDNRPNSGDSRYQLGFVSGKDILARAGFRFWPLNQMGILE